MAIDSETPGIRHSVDGVALHCVEAGPPDGPLVILLHGFPEFWWGWRRQIEPLAEAGFRVIVPDQRGYGSSDRPSGRKAYHLDFLARDVVGLADAHGRRTFHVVGHDWGGLVAWWVAARYPERVERLVAINAPHPGVVSRYMRKHPRQILRSLYVGFFQLPRLPEAVLSAGNYGSLKRALTETSRPGTFPDEDLARYEQAWSRPGALTAMLNWYRALPLSSGERGQGRLPMPVLVLWGMLDRYLEEGLADESLGLCEDGRFKGFETATHWVHLEEADAVSAALVAFLKPAPSTGG